MAGAAAEQVFEEQRADELPLVLVVPELPEDEFSRHSAERLIRFAGRAAVHEAVEVMGSQESRLPNLMVAIHRAAEGDQEAIEFVRVNLSTDALERTLKAGQVASPVILSVDEHGKIWQYGQAMAKIQQNTLQYASSKWQMRERAEPEARNSVRIENLNRQGLLQDYYFVVWSRAASDTMTQEQLKNAGFFVDTMSCAIQATTAAGDMLTTEAAFVAGVTEPGGTQHDEQTVVKVAASLGVDYVGKSTAEIIDTPMLIHKSLMPNGVIDLVKLYDDMAGGTFFGEAKPRQDYLQYKEFCRRREETYLPKIQQSMGELLAEAGQIKTPLQAIQRLHKISEKNMLKQALHDKSINPLVFGDAAASYLEQARLHTAHGNSELAEAAMARAQKLAKSSSCPSALEDEQTIAREANGSNQPETETWHGGKKYYNSKCFSCKKVKPVVGACHICKDCVHNPAKMEQSYKEEKATTKLAQIISIGELATEKETRLMTAKKQSRNLNQRHKRLQLKYSNRHIIKIWLNTNSKQSDESAFSPAPLIRSTPAIWPLRWRLSKLLNLTMSTFCRNANHDVNRMLSISVIAQPC